jgi:hypothetical protein
MPTEEAELVTEEFKRVKRKVGRFKLKKKKISAEDIKSSAPKIPKALLSPPEEESEEDLTSDKKSTIESDLEPIDNKLDELIDVIRKDFNAESKQQKLESRKDQNKLRDQRESKREGKRQSNILGSAAKKAIKPFTGILDRLKRFAMFTFAGFLVDKVLKFFTDPKNIKKREAVLNFLEDHGPKLFAGALLFLTPLGGLFIGLTATLLKVIGGIGGGILVKAIGLLATPFGLKALALALAATGIFATVEFVKNYTAGGSGFRAAIEAENKKIRKARVGKETTALLDPDDPTKPMRRMTVIDKLPRALGNIPVGTKVRRLATDQEIADRTDKTLRMSDIYIGGRDGGSRGRIDFVNEDMTEKLYSREQIDALASYRANIARIDKEKAAMYAEIEKARSEIITERDFITRMPTNEEQVDEFNEERDRIKRKYQSKYLNLHGNPAFFENLFGMNQPEQPVRREDESEESFLEREQRRMQELLNATFGSGGEPESVETSPEISPPVLREGFSTIEDAMKIRGMSPTSSVSPPAPTTVGFIKLPDKFETASAANQPVKSGNEIPDFKIVNLHNRRVQVTNALGIGELV